MIHIIPYSLSIKLSFRGYNQNKSVNTVLLISVVETVIENWLMEVKSTLIFLSDFMVRRRRIILTVIYFGLFQVNVYKWIHMFNLDGAPI